MTGTHKSPVNSLIESGQDPEFLVHIRRAMHGKNPMQYYVAAREKAKAADRRDFIIMSRLSEYRSNPETLAQYLVTRAHADLVHFT